MKKPAKKIILDLCGGTGAWSEPYRQAGYDVRLITLPNYDIHTYIPPKNVYGILAAPPCTMFSFARTNAKKPRDLEAGMQEVKVCLRIIWQCRAAGGLKFWALENPVGYLRQFLGKPLFTFQPWEFGDMRMKETDIWGFFNLPKKTHSRKPEKFDQKWWGNPHKPKGYAHLKLYRADIRAITPKKFAEAFFKANP